MAGEVAESAPTILWQVRRFPFRGLRTWCWTLAAITVAANTTLLPLLTGPGTWWLGLLVGGLLGGLIPAHVLRGALCRVHTDGTLHFGYRDRLRITLPLAQVESIRSINAGLLHGVGLSLPPELVRFADRRGPGFAAMRAWRRGLGVDLVLEFLLPEDGAELERLRNAFRTAPGSAT